MRARTLGLHLTQAATLLAACTTSPDTPPGSTDLSLRGGEDVRVENSVLRVTFTRVLGDSRCPVDVICVWEGNAEVEVGIAAGTGPTHPLVLNSSLEPRQVVWNGHTVALLRVAPDRRSDRVIPFESYRIVVRITPN